MMPKRVKQQLVFSVSLCLSLLFNNCGNIEITPLQQVQLASVQSAGKYCSDPGLVDSDILNFIFVVDMSNSNVVLPGDGTMLPGTDQSGRRFQVIREFISSACLDARPQIRISVIGFSTNSVTPAGVGCQASLFVSKAQSEGQISFLQNIQNTEQPTILAGDSTPTMNRTHYLEGFTCVESLVTNHLNSLPAEARSKNAYQVYFLTDGLPNDTPFAPAGGDALSNPGYKPALLQKIESINNSAQASAGLRISPIFYGVNFLSPTNQTRARDIMEFIAEKGNSVLTLVENVASIDFCGLLRSGRKEPFTVKKFGVVNLNAKVVNGMLEADSDMDGIIDREETDRGLNPANPRSSSNKILDGLCVRGSSSEQCRQQVSSLSNCGAPNSIGLNSCDLQSRSLTNGLDSDGDDLPDYVEILKGLSPNTPLLFDQNIDQDNLPDRLEIDRGRDPLNPDDQLDAEWQLQWTHRQDGQSNATCASSQESWFFELSHIPLVQTRAVSLSSFADEQDREFYNHAENENVVLLYYIVEKLNHDPSNSPESYLFTQKIKVSYTNPVIRLGEFELAGKIQE